MPVFQLIVLIKWIFHHKHEQKECRSSFFQSGKMSLHLQDYWNQVFASKRLIFKTSLANVFIFQLQHFLLCQLDSILKLQVGQFSIIVKISLQHGISPSGELRKFSQSILKMIEMDYLHQIYYTFSPRILQPVSIPIKLGED